MKEMRLPVLVVIVALVAIALLFEPDARPYTPAAALPGVRGASLSEPEAQSDVWFCAAGTASDGGLADHRVTLVNTTDADRVATLTVVSARISGAPERPPVSRAVRLAGRSRAEVRLAEVIGPAAYASATVEVDGGGVLVEHSVNNAQLGFDRVPCASTTSDHWFVPIAVTGTEKNAPARALLAVYNPYGDDAVVDITFITDGGTTPPPINAAVVAARSVSVFDLNVVAPVLAEVATTVIARTGRVVVERLQVFDEAKTRDLVLTRGVSSLASAIVFPEGRLAPNRQERVVLFNGSDERVTATIEVRPDDRSRPVEPFDVAVAPHRLAIVDLSSEQRLTEAAVTGYALVVHGDRPALAVERLVTVTPGQPGAGAGSSTGAVFAATELVVDAASSGPDDLSEIAVFNPDRRAVARVSFDVIAAGARTPAPATTAFELQPGERRVVRTSAFGTGPFTLVVQATAPVMAEREMVGPNFRWHAIAVPSRGDAAVVDVVSLDVDH